MKKILFSMMAVAGLFASCQSNLEPVVVDEVVNVSIEVGTPEVATRAYSDGMTATKLQYAVYDVNGKKLDVFTETNGEIHGKTTVDLQLTTGNTYNVLFWASAPDAPYTVDLASKTMTVDYNKVLSNDENLDAFYKWETIEVTGPMSKTVQLKRPFAQLNVGTNDFEEAAATGYVPAESYVKVTSIYKTLNLANGEVSNEEAVEFALNTIPTGETFPVENYDYLAMNYLLVGNDKEVVDVEFGYKANGEAEPRVRTVGSVPVQRNHRTNLYGQLLTSDVEINVEILPDYDEDDKYGAIDGQVYVRVDDATEFNDAFVDNNVDIIILNNDVVVEGPLTRASADPTLTVSSGKVLTIDLNGKTLSAVSAETGKNYNLFDVRGTLTVKNGTVEIEHVGTNMGWGNSTNVFNVTAGGVLNIADAEISNLGGSDMAFVAHLNNWGEVTLNVENSVLTSTYVAVRVFNSGNDMNNVTIKNTTLQGANYAFWVHNYTVADFGTQEKADAQKALLNLDIFGNGNTFIAAKSAVRLGFTNEIFVDENGVEFIPVGGTEDAPAKLEDTFADLNANPEKNPVIKVAAGSYVEWTTGGGHGSTPFVVADNAVTETVTIQGAEGSVLVVKGAGVGQLRAANGAKLIFKDITIVDESKSYDENAWEFTYLEFSGNLEFNNVTFQGGIQLDSASGASPLNATFTNCTFITNESSVYGVWVCDGVSTFSNCKFQGTRGLKMHEAYGSEVKEVMIDACEFGPLSKKPGVAIGTVNADTKVTIQNSSFIGCQAGEQGNGIYETDTDVTTFTFVTSNNVTSVSTPEQLSAALAAGQNVVLVSDVDITKIDLTKGADDVVIDANGHKITTASNYGIEISAGKNVTVKNAEIVMTVKGDYITYAAGIKVNNGDYAGQTITFENCKLRMINTDWAYAVNMPASVKNLNLVIDNCVLEGAIALQCWGDNNKITINGGEMICNYTTSAMYTSYCVVLQGDGSYAAENNVLSISDTKFSYSGVDNYNSVIGSVVDRTTSNTNKVTVTNCTYEGVEAY